MKPITDHELEIESSKKYIMGSWNMVEIEWDGKFLICLK
jgi:hypothetical protein